MLTGHQTVLASLIGLLAVTHDRARMVAEASHLRQPCVFIARRNMASFRACFYDSGIMQQIAAAGAMSPSVVIRSDVSIRNSVIKYCAQLAIPIASRSTPGWRAGTVDVTAG
jgi:hypothetical protein